MAELPEAVSIQQTAKILGVHYMTVYRWIGRGWIKACRVGPRLIRIPRSEIVRMRTLRVSYQEKQEHVVYPQV